MERLVKLLTEIEDSDIEPQEYLNETHHSAVPLIETLLCDVLITSDGLMDYDAKSLLESHNFILFPLACAEFGWITGAVPTNKGAIAFG